MLPQTLAVMVELPTMTQVFPSFQTAPLHLLELVSPSMVIPMTFQTALHQLVEVSAMAHLSETWSAPLLLTFQTTVQTP